MSHKENLLRDFGCQETLLQSEIGFWRDMIEACGEREAAETVERMQQALALAERRLATLLEFNACDEPVAPNVYRLKQKRRRGR
jgi:hypothetical protein